MFLTFEAKSRSSLKAATATKNERCVGLFLYDKAVGNKVGKEGFGAFGRNKVALKFLKAMGKAHHIIVVRTLTVETAASAELVEEVGWRGGDHSVAILQRVGCCHAANFFVLNLK